MKQTLLSKLPILLALLFCAYAYGLIIASLGAQNALREKEIAKAAAETQHHAAMLGSHLVEQRRDLEELAQSPEIVNYLTNKALGMSLRYGLLASQEAIHDLFVRSFAKQRIDGESSYSRYLFMDANGEVIVDTSQDQPLPSRIREQGAEAFGMDRQTSVMTIAAPVSFKDLPAGKIVAWSDLGKLLRFMIPEEGEGYVALLLNEKGEIVYSGRAEVGEPESARMRELLKAPAGKASNLLAGEHFARKLVLKDGVPNSDLVLLTMIDEEIVFAGLQSSAFLIIAGILPPVVLFVVIVLEGMRRRSKQFEEELKASRLRLLEITDHLAEGVVLAARSGKILFINQSALRILGSDLSKDDALGRSLDELFTLYEKECRVAFQNGPWLSMIDGTKAAQADDSSFMTAEGQVIPVTFGVSPFNDRENGRTAIISFLNNEQLKNAQRELLQASRLASVGQLAAGIAHEINTPIQYVSDNLHFFEQAVQAVEPVLFEARRLAKSKSNGDEGKRLLDAFEKGDIDYFGSELPGAIKQSLEGVAQVSRIVLSMKEFSHPGTIGKSMANINRALESTITVSRNSWKHFAKVETNLAPDLPAVYCHVGEINQVFLNLILNAAQAIEESGKPLPGLIAISTKLDGDKVVIEIADSGTGIPLELRGRVFDPFFTTKAVGKGTGQGLAISMDVVARKHGGRLDVGGTPGEGAVFTITLPIGNDHDEGQDA